MAAFRGEDIGRPRSRSGTPVGLPPARCRLSLTATPSAAARPRPSEHREADAPCPASPSRRERKQWTALCCYGHSNGIREHRKTRQALLLFLETFRLRNALPVSYVTVAPSGRGAEEASQWLWNSSQWLLSPSGSGTGPAPGTPVSMASLGSRRYIARAAALEDCSTEKQVVAAPSACR